MATRSTIGIELPDGRINGIYCHFDGYFEGVGRTLSTYYTNRDEVIKLISLGDISILGNTLDETVAYHRDRGEDLKNTASQLYPTRKSFCTQSYAYIFTLDDKWVMKRCCE